MDWDIWQDYLGGIAWTLPEGTRIDWHHEPEFREHRALLRELSIEAPLNDEVRIATPDFLYTLKVSHSFWNIKWQKTINDIVFLKRRGCKLHPGLCQVLYKLWERVHGAQARESQCQQRRVFHREREAHLSAR